MAFNFGSPSPGWKTNDCSGPAHADAGELVRLDPVPAPPDFVGPMTVS